jgi:radical SAM protein with 4Fe4S-binding SPASM domain
LTTNGTLLNEKIITLIENVKFKNVSFSVDGVTKETYEKIRENGRFDSTIENISDFKDRIKDCYYAINYTVSKINLCEIPDAVEFFEKMGFDHLGFISMVVRSGSEEVRNLSIEKDLAEYTRLLDETAQKVIERNYKITISSPQFLHDRYLSEKYKDYLIDTTLRSRKKSSVAPFNPRNAFQTGSFPGMQIECRSPFVFARILYDGNVLLCNRFVIGNIYENSLLNIWHSNRANFVRKIIMNNVKVCSSCDYYRFCLKAQSLDYMKEETHYADSIAEDINPHLIEGYKNYNIVLWRNKYYSIHRALGRIGLELFLADFNNVEGIVIAGSIEDSKKAIDEIVARSTCLQPMPVSKYNGYNIVAFTDKYFGIPISFGEVDIVQVGYYDSIIKSNSFEGIKQSIDSNLLCNGCGSAK